MLRRSCLASYVAVGITALFSFVADRNGHWRGFVDAESANLPFYALLTLFANVFPDYMSLLETRCALRAMVRKPTLRRLLIFLLVDLGVTFALALGACLLPAWLFADVASSLGGQPVTFEQVWDQQVVPIVKAFNDFGSIWFYPAFFTSIWLWLYAGSGFLLKAARRFDVGFEWFNQKFDIEKKPLRAHWPCRGCDSCGGLLGSGRCEPGW